MTKEFLKIIKNARGNFIKRDVRITARTCFSAAEMASFAVACSEKGEGRVWRCCYCQEFLTMTTIRFDHRYPLKLGGPTILANLTICCHRCNTMKGQLDEFSFRRLRGFLEGLPPGMRKDIEGRLCAGPRWRGRRGKPAKSAAELILENVRARARARGAKIE